MNFIDDTRSYETMVSHISELRDRMQKGASTLDDMCIAATDDDEKRRLHAKAMGLRTAMSYVDDIWRTLPHIDGSHVTIHVPWRGSVLVVHDGKTITAKPAVKAEVVRG